MYCWSRHLPCRSIYLPTTLPRWCLTLLFVRDETGQSRDENGTPVPFVACRLNPQAEPTRHTALVGEEEEDDDVA